MSVSPELLNPEVLESLNCCLNCLLVAGGASTAFFIYADIRRKHLTSREVPIPPMEAEADDIRIVDQTTTRAGTLVQRGYNAQGDEITIVNNKNGKRMDVNQDWWKHQTVTHSTPSNHSRELPIPQLSSWKDRSSSGDNDYPNV
jgi:hypothetical protein